MDKRGVPAKILALMLVLAGVLMGLSIGGGAWAGPAQNPPHQTVPTLTPTSAPRTPTPPSPPMPTLPPSPTSAPRTPAPPSSPPPTPTPIPPRPGETAVPTPFLLPTAYPPEEVIILPGGRASIQLPGGILGPGETLTLRLGGREGLTRLGGSLFPIGETFFLEGLSAAGKSIEELAQPITLIVAYTEEELARAGGDPRSLLLAYYDHKTGNWRLLEARLDLLRRLLSVQVKSPGTYALLALQPTILPPTGSSGPER